MNWTVYSLCVMFFYLNAWDAGVHYCVIEIGDDSLSVSRNIGFCGSKLLV